MSKRAALGLLLVIVLIGVGLRTYQLTARSLWFDEAFSWRLSEFPLAEMIARDARDVHPPLYYIVLKGWTAVFGASLLALRSFSVAMAALTIVAGYLLLSYALSARGAGLIAALFLALSGFEIQFAWEARMYTLGTALALFSTWCLLHALRQRSHHPGWWLAYGVAAAAFAYTHYYAFFSLAGHAVLVVGYVIASTRGRVGEILQWRLFWYAVLAAVVAIALFAPWLPTFLRQQQQVQASFWIPSLGRWSVPDTFVHMYVPTTRPLPRTGIGLAATLLPLVATLMLWLTMTLVAWRGRTQRSMWWCLLLMGVVPFVASIAFSLASPQSVYQDRFFIFAQLFVLLGWAAVLWQIPWRALRAAAISLAAAGLLAASVQYWYEIDIPRKPGAHAAAREIFTQRVGTEPVVVSSPFVFFAIAHYAEEEFGETGVVKLFSETGELAHFAGGPVLTEADAVGTDIFTDAQTTALWVVDTTGFGGSRLPLPAGWHATAEKSFAEVYGYQGDVTVTRYEYSRGR